MKAYVLSIEQKIGKYCQFKEYNNKTKKIEICGCVPCATIGANAICMNHLPDVLIRVGAIDMFCEKQKSKTDVPFWCKEDFLNYCKEKSN